MNAISIKNLSKVYSNGTKALSDVNLEIEEGDFFALLGSNGAGKTTIIGILTSLVNKTSGEVSVFEHNIEKDFSAAKKMVGVVPQEFNFNMFEKVGDIVVSQAGYFGIPREEAIKRLEPILKQLELWEKRDVVARTLSGGMKRRLMIARALIHKPRLLILDEPTAGVDVDLRYGMWEYLTKLNKEEGVTILLTTHYLEEVEQLCQNAAIIKKGEIIKKDSVKNLLGSLDQEIYVVDVDSAKKIAGDSKYSLTVVDETTVEATLLKEQDLNELMIELDRLGLKVHGIRPKGNRLETLFLNLTKN